AMLTDNRPALTCWPRDSSADVEVAAKTKQVMEYVWEITRMDEKLPKVLRDLLISGIGILKIDFNAQVNYPYGEIDVEAVHPDFVLVDPDATCEENIKYVIQRVPTPLWLIRKDFEMGKFVKPDESISIESESDAMVVADIDKEYMGSGGMDVRHKRAYLYEVWVNDLSEHEKDVYEDGELVAEKGQLKYPNGRKIVAAGDVLLADEPCPFDDGHPYVFFFNYDLTDSFWPLGDVEFLIETNSDINKIVSRLNEYIKNTAHTFLVYDDACDIDEETINNLEGAIVKKSSGGQFAVYPPPSWPASIFEWLAVCKSDLEIISGVREVLMGRNPKAGTSGAAFERLQEFALGRIRKKARNVDNGIIKVGKKFVSRLRQYYTEERQIRITGDTPMSYDFIPFSGTELRRETGENIELDIIMEVGSAASVTRFRDRQEAAWLFDKGIIDDEEVAKRYDIRNFKEIKARMEAKQQELMRKQAEMQQQLQALQGGGDVGGQEAGQPMGLEIPVNGQGFG
ncbi:MAG: hypothetical protein PHH57_08020, partial [Candidatus Omnitrophica bacterium]|nr:hypothetical protein [Candidatus Omnitrophota bacterium]